MKLATRILLALAAAASCASARQVSVTLLATTDLHGNIFPIDPFTNKPAARGLAKMASLVRAERRANPNSLLIDCGDDIQGTPMEAIYQRYVTTGHLPLSLAFSGPPLAHDPMMLAMNALGYSAMVLGNHEFNFGLKSIERARDDARFPWLSANTAVEPGAAVKPFKPYIVETVGGVRVAIVGLTTPDIPNWDPPEHYRGYRFLPIAEIAQKTVDELRRTEKPDVVVLAVHDGVRREFASSLKGVDAIVYGHTHQEQAGERAGDVLLVQPRRWGISLARIDFTLDNAGGGWKVVDKRSRLIPATADTPADPEILTIARPYHELAERYLDTPIAESPAEMTGARGRFEDTPLVDAIHAVQMHYGKADVSLTSLFNPRVHVRKGRITVREIAALYIYENELYVVEGDGRMLRSALENAARYFRTCPDAACSSGPLLRTDRPGYNFDMAEGVEYEIDLRKPEGQRIVNLRFKGKPLDPERKLRIAINNYRAGGSGGYTMFRGARVVWKSSEEIRNLMIEYYIAHKRLPERADGNWRIVPEQAVAELEREAASEPLR